MIAPTTQPALSEAISETAALLAGPRHASMIPLECYNHEMRIAELMQSAIRRRTVVIRTAMVDTWYSPYGWRDIHYHEWFPCDGDRCGVTRAPWRVEISTRSEPSYYCDKHLPLQSSAGMFAGLSDPDDQTLVRILTTYGGTCDRTVDREQLRRLQSEG